MFLISDGIPDMLSGWFCIISLCSYQRSDRVLCILEISSDVMFCTIHGLARGPFVLDMCTVVFRG